jgi:putative PIN family toxin of toxin-antitoxin system
MRVVLDANVLGPGLLLEHGDLVDIVRSWQEKRIEVCVSDHISAELAITLEKAYWRSRFAPTRIERALLTVRRSATRVVPTPGIERVATHWHDDVVIATAVAADADYLVTGDKELLRLKAYRSVRIVSPLEFLEILRAEDGAES